MYLFVLQNEVRNVGLTKQKAVIRPFIGLLKGSKIGITADREFHSIFLLIYSCIRNRNIVKNLLWINSIFLTG